MHPAYSVIIFTTASGAGYGLLALLALGGVTGLVQPERLMGLIGFGLSLSLITAGLLSSTFHLGRPERAWRAFSQWRSSWLSREGVAAVAAYPPAGIAALGWVIAERADGLLAAAGIAAALLALATLYCTGQIYQSLRTIPQWHERLTTPVYMLIGLATGGMLLNALLHLLGSASEPVILLSALLIVASLAAKALYWMRIDGGRPQLTAEMATGLGSLGRVRPLDPPHTQPNYVMREMGYEVGRRHAAKLRLIATLALFGAPLMLTLTTLAMPPALAAVAAVLSAGSAGLGVLVERWLFFAEARHVSMLYYGRSAA
jgi:DMSO reductase anchor subunit